MKAYCSNCGELKAASFRLFIQNDCPDEYEDLCCDSCDLILATIDGGYVSKMQKENAELKKTLDIATEANHGLLDKNAELRHSKRTAETLASDYKNTNAVLKARIDAWKSQAPVAWQCDATGDTSHLNWDECSILVFDEGSMRDYVRDDYVITELFTRPKETDNV